MSVPGLGGGPGGLSFPMSQYPAGMGHQSSSDCHQIGYDLSHHHHQSSFIHNSFANHPNAHQSAAAAAAHGMTPFPDYGKQSSEEYSKAMHSMAAVGSEGHHFAKAATATGSSSATMIDCYAKLAPEANNNWNHHQSYANTTTPANPGPYPSSAAANGSLCQSDFSNHHYGINIGHNF